MATPYTSVAAGKKALFIGEYNLTSPQGSAFQLSTVDKITHEKRTIDVSKFDESNLEVSTIAPHVHLSVLMLPDSNGCTKSEALVYAQQYISNYGDPTGTDDRFQTLRVVVHNTETGEQQKIFAEIESNSGRPFDFDQTTITEVVHHENDILVICRNGVWRLKNENTQYTTSFEPFMYVPNGTATAAFDKKTGQLFFANTSGNGDIVAGKLTYDPHEKSWTPNVSTKVLRKSETDGWHGVVGGDTYARSLIVTPDEDHDARLLFVPCAWLNKPPFDGNAHFGILHEPILFQDGDFSRATNRTFNKRRYELLARQAPGGILMLETDEINQANLTLAFYPTKQPRNLVESNVNRCQAILPRVQNRDSDPTN